MRQYFLYIFFVFSFYFTFATNSSTISVELKANVCQQIDLPLWTSFVVEEPAEWDWVTCVLILEKDTILLKLDAHSQKLHSQQIFSQNKNQAIQLLSSQNLQLKIHVFNVEEVAIIPNLRVQETCEEPMFVSVNEWRNSPTVLHPPLIKPVKTTVKHVIIHHSASSNTATNYYNEVRNIYVYHTESNGWDDIGYNYLIAPDGTIFQGRDAQGVAAIDNIRGAHMCNKNDSTMAICLLGDYTNISPSTAMLNALYQLTAWKLVKENLDPFEKSVHTIGPTSANMPNALLAHVAGHRDGCQQNYTECPGQKVYDMLDNIRQQVANKMDNCIAKVEENQFVKNYQFQEEKIIFFEPKEHIFVYKTNGQEYLKVENQSVLDYSTLEQGIYIVKVIEGKQIQLIKIIKI